MTGRHFFNRDKWNIFAVVVFFEQKKAEFFLAQLFIINFLLTNQLLLLVMLRKTILYGFLFIFTSYKIFMNLWIALFTPLCHYSPEIILFNHHKQIIIFGQNILYAFSILLLCKNELSREAQQIFIMVFSIIQFL